MDVWAAEQSADFLRYIAGVSPRRHALYVLALTTGMRRSELAGLAWHNVDFDRQSVRIEQTRLHVAGDILIEEPKTVASRRTITLHDQAIGALRKARRIQANDQTLLGHDWIDSGFVFCKPTGEPLHPDYITKRFGKDCIAAGARYIGFHGLRHTFATTALLQRVNPRLVAEILGHSDIQTTLGIYSQFVPGAHADVMGAVEAALFESQDPRE